MEALLTGKNAQKLDAGSVFSVSDIPDVKFCVAYTFALTGRRTPGVGLCSFRRFARRLS